VFDKNGNLISASLYDSYPEFGLIVFKQRYVDKLTIGIENSSRLRVGIKITNKDAFNNVEIDGIGYMYNTNVFLPRPLARRLQ
jgi:hypothetical protein